jgi:hypothetical protein
MNNNFIDNRHPAQQVSGPNKYLYLAMQTRVPLTIHFVDGEVIPLCVLTALDALNLLISVLKDDLTPSHDMVVTRSNIKKIVFGIQKGTNNVEPIKR